MNSHFCGSSEHDVSRRAFLRTLGAGTGLAATGIGAVHSFATPSLNDTLKAGGKSVILLWLAGGASQLETWDPKPGRPTGGPFAGKQVISGAYDGQLIWWDAESRQKVRGIKAHDRWIRNVVATRDGQLIASTAMTWSAASGTPRPASRSTSCAATRR